MSSQSTITTMLLFTSAIITIYLFVELDMVGYQSLSSNGSNFTNLTGRINSMLTPVPSSSDSMGGMIMTPDSAMMNMTGRDEQNHMEAMRFSMAQDVTWLLSGDWSLLLSHSNDTAATTEPKSKFDAEFTKITSNGTMKHSHKISNFSATSYSPDLNVKGVSGSADVYFNNELAWPNSNMNVTTPNDEVLRIEIDSEDIDNHFHGQPIYGVATE